MSIQGGVPQPGLRRQITDGTAWQALAGCPMGCRTAARVFFYYEYATSDMYKETDEFAFLV